MTGHSSAILLNISKDNPSPSLISEMIKSGCSCVNNHSTLVSTLSRMVFTAKSGLSFFMQCWISQALCTSSSIIMTFISLRHWKFHTKVLIISLDNYTFSFQDVVSIINITQADVRRSFLCWFLLQVIFHHKETIKSLYRN